MIWHELYDTNCKCPLFRRVQGHVPTTEGRGTVLSGKIQYISLGKLLDSGVSCEFGIGWLLARSHSQSFHCVFSSSVRPPVFLLYRLVLVISLPLSIHFAGTGIFPFIYFFLFVRELMREFSLLVSVG